MRVRPLRESPEVQGLLLLSFVDIDQTEPEAEAGAPAGKLGSEAAVAGQLERGLKATREELQTSIKKNENASEELKAWNEEAMSMNEKLSTIKSLLEQKKKELKRTNDDINNLLSGTEIAIVFLDTAMRIKRFTPQCARLFNLRASDVGRPLADLSPTFHDGNLLDGAIRALEYLVPLENEVVANDETRYLRRIQPYRTQDNRIDGVVISFIDITLRAKAEEAVRVSEERYRMLYEYSPTCLLEQDWSDVRRCLLALCPEPEANLADWVTEHPEQAANCRERVRLQAINGATLRLLGVASAKVVSEANLRFFPMEPQPQFQALLGDLLRGRGGVHEFDVRTLDGRIVPVLVHTVPASGFENSLERVLVAVIDISDQKAKQRRLADREQRLTAILDNVVDGIVGVGPHGIISEFSAAAERLFECPAHKAIGQSLQRFLQPGPAQAEVGGIMQLLDGQKTADARMRLCEGVRANGELFPVEVLGAEVDHLGIYVLLVRDVSQQRELERQIIESSTREQQRIGQLIHNGLGQQLTAVTMLASVLANKLGKLQRPEAAEARQLAEELERVLLDSKAIIQGLAPADVAPKRLVNALKTLADQVSCATGVRCDVHGECEIRTTDRLMTTHLYRIAQEALNNAVRHGEPSHIDIRLQRSEGRVRLSVCDDGKWADKPRGGPDGLGLHIMAYRASILGGTMTVKPQTEGGTLMLCEIPLVVD